jgi:dTDP-4-dehydrorhamnose reductase
MTRILVTGTQGQVARALSERGGEIVALGRPELDLAADADFTPLFAPLAPDLIVNAAAYTAVDKAESEPDLAFAVNERGAGRVAKAAAALGVPVIQLSTDYVFAGGLDRPLVETDPTGPAGVYAASKLAGERAVAAATADHVILRTAWVYAPYGANFLRTMLRLASTRDEIGVVADQFGAPTSALDIAEAVLRVAEAMRADPGKRGVYHFAAAGGPVSWADFAEEIFRQSAARGGPAARVKRIATSDYPTPAKRPAWSLLDCGKFRQGFQWTPPDWHDGVATVMDRLAEGGKWA